MGFLTDDELEALIPEDMQKKYGFQPLGGATGPVKTAIFSGNNMRLYGLQKRTDRGDRFAGMKGGIPQERRRTQQPALRLRPQAGGLDGVESFRSPLNRNPYIPPVILGLVPGIHLSVCSSICGWLAPGDKHRDDKDPAGWNSMRRKKPLGVQRYFNQRNLCSKDR